MKICAAFVTLVGILSAGSAAPALAGKGAFLPTYHAPPCSRAECRGDDPRSGLPCQGFLCTVTSAGAMQPPITAAQAAEMEKARAAEAAAAAAVPPAGTDKKRVSAKTKKAKPPKTSRKATPPVVPVSVAAPALPQH